MNLQRKVYLTRSQKIGDFFIGVGLCIGLNILLSTVLGFGIGLLSSIPGVYSNGMAQSVVNILSVIAYGVPCLIQIGLVIYFGLTRYWIALGMLATIAFGLLLTLILVAACFVLIAGLSGGFNK